MKKFSPKKEKSCQPSPSYKHTIRQNQQVTHYAACATQKKKRAKLLFARLSFSFRTRFCYLGRWKAMVISLICSGVIPSGSKPMLRAAM